MKMYNPKLNSAKSAMNYINDDIQNSGLVKTGKLVAKIIGMMNTGGGAPIEEAGGTSSSFSSTFK